MSNVVMPPSVAGDSQLVAFDGATSARPEHTQLHGLHWLTRQGADVQPAAPEEAWSANNGGGVVSTSMRADASVDSAGAMQPLSLSLALALALAPVVALAFALILQLRCEVASLHHVCFHCSALAMAWWSFDGHTRREKLYRS